MQDQSWIENICMKNKILPNETFKLEKYLKLFDSKLKSELETKTNKKDYAGHFSRWLTLELQKDKKINGEKLTGAAAFINQLR